MTSFQRRTFSLALAAAGIFLAPSVFAHPGHLAGDFAGGVAHPFSGLDHILAMLAVGLWAGQTGGRSIWLVPLAFVLAMLGGGMLGCAHVPLPFVESGIAASLLVLGLLVAAAYKVRPASGALLVVVFALFHGHAHGAELAGGSSALLYSLGFVTATAALHAVGVGLAVWNKTALHEKLVRYAGVGIAVCALPVWLGY